MSTELDLSWIDNITPTWGIKLPTYTELLHVIEHSPGVNMSDLHNLGYRLVFTPLQQLLNNDVIFEDDYRYYPNR
jgi:hypothetical protein